VEKEIKNWLDSAQYDLETAAHMFDNGRYIYTIFMCHLAIEKILKAKAEASTGETPPKTHNLLYLIKLSRISMNEESLQFIGDINNLSIVTRYPKDFEEMVKTFSKQRTEEILNKSKEVFEWIKNLITL
jgi:HEPN domain-containing protein